MIVTCHSHWPQSGRKLLSVLSVSCQEAVTTHSPASTSTSLDCRRRRRCRLLQSLLTLHFFSECCGSVNPSLTAATSQKCESHILTCQHPTTDASLRIGSDLSPSPMPARRSTFSSFATWVFQFVSVAVRIRALLSNFDFPTPETRHHLAKEQAKEHSLEYSISLCANCLRPRHLPRPQAIREKKDVPRA